MTPEALAAAISDALAEVPEVPSDGVEVKVERPKNRDHGDYATNVALVLAKRAGLPPRDLASKIVEVLQAKPGIESLDIAGPGFINITLAADAAGEVAHTIVEQGSTYGSIDALLGTAVNLEFISANPTGPLHLGHTRWAAVGDAMARVLAAAGAQVTREFYVNDRGVQMDKFGMSLEASALGQPVPEGGYQGEYIHDLAARIVADEPGIVDLPEGERMVAFREAGYALQLGSSRRTSWTTSARTSTSGTPSVPCTRRVRSTAAWPSCASRATSSRATVRSGCAPPTSTTTRTGCSSRPTVS
jgi:arginyl-tRNA synthetase